MATAGLPTCGCCLALVLTGCIGSAPLNFGLGGASTAPREESFPVKQNDSAESSPAPSKARLVVNGEAVNAEELWWEMHVPLRNQAQTMSARAYRSYIEQEAARLISDKIAEMLLHQRASLRLPPGADKNVDSHVDAAIRRMIETEYDGVERRFEKSLKEQGLSLERKRQLLRREILISSYLEQEIRPKVPEPTRAELFDAYERIRAEAQGRPERRRMSLIDVRVTSRLSKATSEPTREAYEQAKSEALSTIQKARAELIAGGAFAEVAREYSDGLHAAEGGNWGWMTQGSVRPRFEPAVNALFSLSTGQISDVIETSDGFFVVRCDEIDGGWNEDFQTLQPRLTRHFISDAYNREIVKLVTDLRSKARIEPTNLEQFHAAVVAAVPISAPPDGP